VRVVATYRRKDAAYERAKQEGYRSRAAYKLIELDDRFRLLRPGQRVVDLGCWPGSWLQVASRRIGPSGRVVGVDLVAIDPLSERNVVAIAGDVLDPEVRAQVARALGGRADVVLADLAPKLSGIASSDAARHAALVAAAVASARDWLAPEGALLVKLFVGGELEHVLSELRAAFVDVKTTRPASTRKGSSELYAVCRRLRPGATSDPRPV